MPLPGFSFEETAGCQVTPNANFHVRFPSPLSASSGSAAVDVLNGRLVPPNHLVARQAEDRGDGVALLRAWRPPPQHNRRDTLLVHAGALRQLPGIDAALGTQLIDGFLCLGH